MMTDAEIIADLRADNARMAYELRMIKEKLPRYNWKETTSLPERLRAIASMMHAGAAWGFCGEAMFLDEAADILEEYAENE